MNLKKALASLTSLDVIIIFFINCLSLVAIGFSSVVPEWGGIVLANLLVSAVIIAMELGVHRSRSRLLRLARDWYPVVMVFYVFKLTYLMVHPVHPQDFDWLLIAADRAIFGTDPTRFLARYATPLVTEILQICYSSYYFILIAVFYELYRRDDRSMFLSGGFLIVYGFFLSYIGYFALPAVGPRFTLHNFDMINHDLPGLWLTPHLRAWINAGESIPAEGMSALAAVQRDVFPSGHTELTLVALYVAFKNRIASRWVLAVIGSLLIVATVYLRYHYVVDLIGGFIFFLLTIWSGKKIDQWWKNWKRRGTAAG